MAKPSGYVDLDRQFSRLDGTAAPENAAARSYLSPAHTASGDYDWKGLLEERLVVILGEPGSGKSWELRAQHAAMQQRGEFAFLVELERLIDRPLEDALSPEDRMLFLRWKKSQKLAYFFFDSVDEAKIRQHADFYSALDSVSNAIRTTLGRTRIVISSRIFEWQPLTDKQEVQVRLGGSQHVEQQTRNGKLTESSEAPAAPLVVEMLPLDRHRVAELLEGLRIEGADAFVKALDDHAAWDFARRPIDVVDLAQFWKAKGRLGTLTEIIEHDVTLKLRETATRQNTFPLSEAKAREGAETLAAATIFCKTQQFKVPDDAFIVTGALDARACLPSDWVPAETTALLSRPLFDSAAYGQVKFHHRRVVEYLGAQWIRQRMAQGCPTFILKDELFETVGSELVPRGSLVPIIAWLCAGTERWNDEVRDWVLHSDPELHFEYGDPGALSLDFRKALLRAWVESTAGHDRIWVQSSPETLRRVADPQLADLIVELLRDRSKSVDVRSEIVQLIRYGKLTDCLLELTAILANPEEPENLKMFALAAIRDMGTPESLRQTWEILQSQATLPDAVCGVACEALYPTTIGAAELVTRLQKTEESSDDARHLSWSLKSHFDEYMSPDQADGLAASLNALIQSPPHIVVSGKESRISAKFQWLLDVLPTVIAALLSKANLDETQCEIAGESLCMIAEHKRYFHVHNDKLEKLNEATEMHPKVRRAYFWHSVRRWQAKGETGRPHSLQLYHHGEVVKPSTSDIAWLVTDVESRPEVFDRAVALETALQLSGRPSRGTVRRLRGAVRGNSELTDILRRRLKNHRWAWFYRLRYRFTDGNLKFRMERWFYLVKRKWENLRVWWALHRQIASLRNGTSINALAHLCHEAETDGHKWAPDDWSPLTAKRGNRISRAVQTGCKNSWRRFTPELPHEKESPNSTDYRVVIGLAGVGAMFADDESFLLSITAEDARLATRYAVNEMNGYPAWLSKLSAQRPDDVAHVLNECVRGEWLYPSDRERSYDVLAQLNWQGGHFAKLARAAVLEKLEEGDPPHNDILEHAVSLLLKTIEVPDARLTSVVLSRCATAVLDSQQFTLWAAVGLQLDAEATLKCLEERLEPGAAADKIVSEISETLGAELRPRMALISNPSYLKPPALKRLIMFTYRFVRPQDDIVRKRGSYTPTLRDHAERFRGSLLTRLAESEDTEATECLRSLLSEPMLAIQRDWIQNLLDRRAREMADITPWSPADIREFADTYEHDPATDHDLYRIVKNRLIDIKYDVEESDNSLREEVAENADEYTLRRFLARKLEERAKDRYTIPQEEEIDQEQRPDLRAENPKTNPVSVELKWGDKWTVKELTAGLEEQLVGQYMRAHDSRYGVYVVGTQSRKLSWIGPNGEKFGFAELIEYLVSLAGEGQKNNKGVEGLKVIGIDFSSPK